MIGNAAAGRLASAIAGGLAMSVSLIGLANGTWAAGGSDSSCYALMADAFAHGELQPTSVLASRAPWPDASRTVAPAGFVPSPVRADAASPVCAAGFSLMLAPLRWLFGVDGIFVLTPLAGGLVVWLAFVLGRQLDGPATGVAAAIVTATLPVMLFQVVQPMNDVWSAALWLLVIVAAMLPEPSRPWAVGAVAGLAVLVRPNLAPAALATVAWLMTVLVARDGWSYAILRAILAVVMAAAPSAAILLWLNATLYGHPFQSGYGAIGDLFSMAHISTNVRQYGTALWETERAFPLLGLAAIVAAPGRYRHLMVLAIVLAAVTMTVYLFYRPFPEWWYLRFFLPALVPMGVLACATVRWTASRVLGASRVVLASGVTIVLALGVGWFQAMTPAAGQALDLQRLERRFRTTAEVVRDRFPAHAAFITVWQSGTLRYHAGRETILWDALAPEGLDTAVEWLASQGFEPYLLTEEWEEPLFRARFAGTSALGALDWPPRFVVERQARIYSPSDRERYRAGDDVRTEFVWSR